MTTHANIVRRIGAATAAEIAGVTIYATRQWIQRDSIPVRYWPALVNAGHCTADELMQAAARGKAA